LKDGCYMGSLSGIVIVWSELPRDARWTDPTCSLHTDWLNTEPYTTDLADILRETGAVMMMMMESELRNETEHLGLVPSC
jgi:hypothetical protein